MVSSARPALARMIALSHAELRSLPLRLRMPFRYGIATLTELPHALVSATFEIGGVRATGFAADNLPPKWFTKNAARAPADEIAELFDVIRAAFRHARDLRAATPFAFWQELFARQAAWAASAGLPPLLAHHGTSFVERALLDAWSRAHGQPFAALLRSGSFGLELGALHPSLAGSAPRDWLPAAPSASAFARHTVGLSDPILESDIPPAERVADGLPQSLVACIRAQGLRHFKIKINGEADRDRDRLRRMAATFAAECPDGFAFSLDGNESFRDVAAFAATMRDLMAVPELRALWPHLLFIEQPWHRDVALSPAIGELARAWPDRPPIIIDESDAEPGSLAAALALGYAGTSHKNCKGIFKSAANACLLAQRAAAGTQVVLSGEDLTNVGPIALTQDLAAAAALGITSIERNGHHYFAGLSQFPPALQAHALAHHGDLFVRDPAGWPRVHVQAGRVALGSVNAAPFGVGGAPDLSALPAEEI